LGGGRKEHHDLHYGVKAQVRERKREGFFHRMGGKRDPRRFLHLAGRRGGLTNREKKRRGEKLYVDRQKRKKTFRRRKTRGKRREKRRGQKRTLLKNEDSGDDEQASPYTPMKRGKKETFHSISRGKGEETPKKKRRKKETTTQSLYRRKREKRKEDVE